MNLVLPKPLRYLKLYILYNCSRYFERSNPVRGWFSAFLGPKCPFFLPNHRFRVFFVHTHYCSWLLCFCKIISIKHLISCLYSHICVLPVFDIFGYGPNLGIKLIHQMLLITHESQIDYPTFKKKLNAYRYSFVCNVKIYFRPPMNSPTDSVWQSIYFKKSMVLHNWKTLFHNISISSLRKLSWIIKIINFIYFTANFWCSTNLFIENGKIHIYMWRSSCRSRLKCVTLKILIVRTQSYKIHKLPKEDLLVHTNHTDAVI